LISRTADVHDNSSLSPTAGSAAASVSLIGAMAVLAILFGGGCIKIDREVLDDDKGEDNDDTVDLELQYDTSSIFVPRFSSGEI
jgi:hypothetical protein